MGGDLAAGTLLVHHLGRVGWGVGVGEREVNGLEGVKLEVALSSKTPLYFFRFW